MSLINGVRPVNLHWSKQRAKIALTSFYFLGVKSKQTIVLFVTL
jgi:hypothetical protein